MAHGLSDKQKRTLDRALRYLKAGYALLDVAAIEGNSEPRDAADAKAEIERYANTATETYDGVVRLVQTYGG